MKALVLLSGGIDSTTCLVWALNEFKYVEAVSFDYGQKHIIELENAKKICEMTNVKHTIIKTDAFKQIGNSKLLDKEVKTNHDKPDTFVPGRNLIFLTYACAFAYKKEISNIIIGASQTYSDYPDCYKDTIVSLNKAINLGMDYNFEIFTPLMNLTKTEAIKLIEKFGKLDLLKYTYSCYEGNRISCGVCKACKLRLKSFKELNIKDQIEYK